MHLPPEFVHSSTGYFWEPIIDARKEAKDRAGRDDVMEMGDNIVCIVQVQIAEVEAERQAGETSDPEHGEKGQREKHGCIKADGTAPKGDEQTSQNDHRWYGDDHGGGLEE